MLHDDFLRSQFKLVDERHELHLAWSMLINLRGMPNSDPGIATTCENAKRLVTSSRYVSVIASGLGNLESVV